jgi:hypothetical protein
MTETARQIAERIAGEIAAMTFDRYGNYEYDNSNVADLIEAGFASLTADLAQARLELAARERIIEILEGQLQRDEQHDNRGSR